MNKTIKTMLPAVLNLVPAKVNAPMNARDGNKTLCQNITSNQAVVIKKYA